MKKQCTCVHNIHFLLPSALFPGRQDFICMGTAPTALLIQSVATSSTTIPSLLQSEEIGSQAEVTRVEAILASHTSLLHLKDWNDGNQRCLVHHTVQEAESQQTQTLRYLQPAVLSFDCNIRTDTYIDMITLRQRDMFSLSASIGHCCLILNFCP